MGLLDGILGGVIGAEMTQVVSGLIEKHGGVQGVISQLESQGLGETARSWVGNGSNLPISAEQLQQAFGSNGTLQELASKFGTSYWEGAIDVVGNNDQSPLRGVGYLEMTGYAQTGKPVIPN